MVIKSILYSGDSSENILEHAYESAMRIAEFRGEWLEQLQQLGQMIMQNEQLIVRLLEDHRLLSHDPTTLKTWQLELKQRQTELPEPKELYPLLVLLTLVPSPDDSRFRSEAERDAVLHVFRDLYLWAEDHRQRSGTFGLSNIGWFYNHLVGNLLWIGRLQFQVGVYFKQGVRVYVQRNDPAISIALADRGVILDEHGWWQAKKESPTGSDWVAQLIETGTEIIGYPVQPQTGAIKRETVTLLRDEWELVLQPGDPVLNIHIPADGPLQVEDCRTALMQAAKYYATHLPQWNWRAFVCSSWLLDYQLGLILPPESNIPRYLSQFQLTPVTGSGAAGYERIFGTSEPDLEHIPQNTSLRRAVYHHLQQGHHLKNGAGYILRQVYE